MNVHGHFLDTPVLHTPRGGPTIHEVTAREALTRCTYPGLDWSLNPYLGCSHACRFCYVPTLRHLDREQWGTDVGVKRNLPALLARELRTKQPGLVALSTATDPYQFAEGRCHVTRRCLDILVRADWPLHVLTRSPLILRDRPLLQRFSDLQVAMSLPTLDDRARAVLEPGAPSIRARLASLRKLAEAGLEPGVFHAPAYPPTADGADARGVAMTLADHGVQWIVAFPLRMYGGVRANLIEAVQQVPGLERMADARVMDAYRAELKDACQQEGIAWGVKQEAWSGMRSGASTSDPAPAGGRTMTLAGVT